MGYGYIEEFKNSGLGLFVHFGLYSIIGKGEWYYSWNKKADKFEYESLKNKFLPKKDWAKELVGQAKRTGAKYIVLTTRHHDGFSLYDTKGLSDFDAPHSACGRDLIEEFTEACRNGGIMPIFYHTLLDWHNEDYQKDFKKYIDYLVESLEVLCRNYGKVGGFWFDGMWDKPDEDWQESRIYGTLRKYQPEAIITNNTGLFMQGKKGNEEIDCVTFERGKPFNVKSGEKPLAGEMCQVLNDHWGYAKEDCNYKSVKELIENLVDCRRYNCNFLINTGLKGNGTVNITDKAILTEIGKWLKANKGFIYRACGTEEECKNGYILRDAKTVYVVIKDVGMSADPNVGLKTEDKKISLDKKIKIKKAEWLDSGEEIEITEDNGFYVKPFEYGRSLAVRIAKITEN